MPRSDEQVTFDDEFLTNSHESYARLRREQAVHQVRTPDGNAWLVTRYKDARSALADPRLSLNKAVSRTGYRGFRLPPALDANLLNMDPPDHTRVRRLVSRAFTPRRTERLRPRVRAVAGALLDRIEGQDEADLLAMYAAPLPITVICELLGVGEADRPDFRSWTDTMLAPDPRRPELAAEAVRALHGYLVDLVARKRRDPGDDLLSTLIQLRDDHDQLSEDELISTAFLVLFAGYENTVNLIGNGVVALLSHPDRLAQVRADPALLPTAVEELLRFDPPPQLAIRRFTREEVDIGGVRVPAGETVLISLASAHRDADRFAEPDTLDLSRADNQHLGFGHGPHYCVGASLARMEVEVGLGVLLDRLPELALAVAPEDLEWRPSWRNLGLRALPVRLRSPR